jgi:hypothetical protein
MRRYFTVVFLIAVLVISFLKLAPYVRDRMSIHRDGVNYVSMVDNKYFYINKYGKWDKEFIKGVNIGAAKPGAFPGELAITKEEYSRWLKYIGKMNANTIRVYTILKPAFYEALYEYNQKTVNPIHVMIGVWVNEEAIATYKDVYNPNVSDRFKKDIKDTIDVIHGNAVLPEEKGHASGVYKRDISPYVTGWILGIEWDPELVGGTNENNPDKKNFIGEYLYTEGASPFEAWMCQIGDYTIDYETSKYNMQRPLSFTNWPTADVLKHPNEPFETEDMVTVNPEKIKRKDAFKPGLFASYHIYPYYPDFMNYQKEYRNFKDKDGKINTYRAYLKDLIKEHSVPVLVAEFGIPASRGMAHVNIHTGFNQGNVDEKTQGDMNVSMLRNIYEEGYAGGIVFTWQDEWFKRTWNTMDLDVPERRAYWSNPQTNEQEFGVLAFEPGENVSKCYVDGDISEWKNTKPLVTGNNTSLYINSDEKYIYFMINVKDYNFDKDSLIIPIDSIDGQGNTKIEELNLSLKRPSDFIITIKGEEGSSVKVDAYYDSFYFIYKNMRILEKNDKFEMKNSGIFNPINLCLNRPIYLPEDKIEIPLSYYQTGKLLFGDANPEHEAYNSLADFNANGENIEIRIPWQLFNVMDPSTKMVMDDLYKKGIKPRKTSGLYAGAILIKNGDVLDNSDMKHYAWSEWEVPKYHERLKPSYYIMMEAFKEIGVELSATN